ncbi:MAG: hypothetical protein JNM36_10960 [Chitinophagales bacterium]|nr:hypothetical protein [Chitinophagales bacterium]HNI44688.1 hypothetical protein [Chitinophagales bacterium]
MQQLLPPQKIQGVLPLTLGASINAVLKFLERILPLFAQEYGSKTKNEADLNEDLCHIIQDQKRENDFFYFIPEKYQGGNRRVDFGVFMEQKSEDLLAFKVRDGNGRKIQFFAMEGKRLPTPKKNDKRDLREYVCSNGGAMQRFKVNQHGVGLSQSAIIAYVQEEDFVYWYQQINEWISDLAEQNTDVNIVWTTDEILKEYSPPFDHTPVLARYYSDNTKTGDNINSTIKLHHFWVMM